MLGATIATIGALALIGLLVWLFWDTVVVMFKIWLFNLILSAIVIIWAFLVFGNLLEKFM